MSSDLIGLLFTLEYEDAVGDIHWLKVHKVIVVAVFGNGNCN